MQGTWVQSLVGELRSHSQKILKIIIIKYIILKKKIDQCNFDRNGWCQTCESVGRGDLGTNAPAWARLMARQPLIPVSGALGWDVRSV